MLKLDGWIQKNKGLAQTIGIIAGGALALIGIIGGIGLVAWPVVMGINAIIAAAGVLGTVFTVAGSAIVTALGAITWPIVVNRCGDCGKGATHPQILGAHQRIFLGGD